MFKEYCIDCEEQLDMDCGCAFELSTDCVLYQGDELPDYNIVEGENLTEILITIFNKLDELFNSSGIINGKNVGGGVRIFKSKNKNRELEFKTLISTESLKISEINSEELDFNVDENWVKNLIFKNQTPTKIESIGEGEKILLNDPNGTKYIKSIKSLDSDLYISTLDNTLTIKNNRIFTETPIKSIGIGTPIYKGKVNNNNEIKSIRSNNLIIKEEDNTIVIDAQPAQDIPLDDILSRLVHPGFIQDFYGNVNAIPKGWYICDGTNGTPDLRGMFVVGYDNRVEDYNTVGKSGGEIAVTLDINQLPTHNHTGSTNMSGSHFHHVLVDEDSGWNDYPTSNTFVSKKSRSGDHSENYRLTKPSNINTQPTLGKTSVEQGHTHSINLNATGGGQSHENRPPYYVLVKIMYKG